jgi:hypothetical protein
MERQIAPMPCTAPPPPTHWSAPRPLQLSDLTGDFTYNLGLLAERDAELERYDTSLVEMSSRLTLQAASISSLQGALAEAQAGGWVGGWGGVGTCHSAIASSLLVGPTHPGKLQWLHCSGSCCNMSN